MIEFLASEEAKKLLAAHVATSGWQTEIGAMPATPDEVIMISDTGGLDPNPKWLLDFPTIQVMIRGAVNGYLDTAREGKAVKDLLLGAGAFTTSEGDRWVSITQNGDLSFIGRDEDMRPLFTVNFALIIEPLLVPNSNRLPLGSSMAFAGSGFSIGFEAGFG
jgi:hypothetical protein